VLLKLTVFRQKRGGARPPPDIKVVGLGSCGAPRFRHLCHWPPKGAH